MSNPFFHGNPVSPDQFLDRRRELRRLVSRIRNQGQSSAIVGEPRSGKTSLLEYLAAPELRTELYGADGEQLIFTYLDAQTLGGRFSQAQFWEYALRPLYEQAVLPEPDSPLAQAYEICRENGFGSNVLEGLLAQIRQAGRRLVMMLDEFDVLLHHPILNSAEFFGSLRSLTSRSKGALALVIASRILVESLNREARKLSPLGSPYFNTLEEITLGSWPEYAANELLRRAGARFTRDDRRFIREVAGGHPYLLQTAASVLWEVYEDAEGSPTQRRLQAGQELSDLSRPMLEASWHHWSPLVRRAMVAVTLTQITEMSADAGRSQPDLSNLPAISNLLRDGFDARELRRFCRDREDFSPVLGRFGPSFSQEDMIDVLLEYCQKRLLFVELLAEIRRFNPRQYDRYAPQLAPQHLLRLLELGPELRWLEKRGFVAQDAATHGGWRVRPLVFLWWLADGLARSARNPQAFQEWVRAEELGGVLTAGEERRLAEASRRLGELFPGGVTDLIESAAGGG
jgi:hypothetical protein